MRGAGGVISPLDPQSLRSLLAWFNQRTDAYPAVRTVWRIADDEDDSATRWSDLGIIIRDLVRSHALAILVPLLSKNLDEITGGPLAACLSAGIAAENFKKLHGFDHRITTSIPDQDPVRINVVVVSYLLERTVE